jgi:hypothetical protein
VRRPDWPATLVGTLLLSILPTACTPPGPRADGTGRAGWAGPDSARISGRCVYSVTTRWAAPLNHSIRWRDDSSELSVVLSSSRRLGEGSRELDPDSAERDPLVLVMDGATVIGAVRGAIETRQSGDSVIHAIRGEKVHRDTLPFQAECRLGSLDAD